MDVDKRNAILNEHPGAQNCIFIGNDHCVLIFDDSKKYLLRLSDKKLSDVFRFDTEIDADHILLWGDMYNEDILRVIDLKEMKTSDSFTFHTEIKNGIYLLEYSCHSRSEMSLLRLSDMKHSSWIPNGSYEEIWDGLFLFTYKSEFEKQFNKRFFRVKDFIFSPYCYHFASYKIKEDGLECISEQGSSARLLKDLTLSPWKF